MNNFIENERYESVLASMWEACVEVGYLSLSQGGLTNFLLEYDYGY